MNNQNNLIQWITLVLVGFMVIMWGIDSCNKQSGGADDNSEIKQLVKEHVRKSDSLFKSAIDTMTAIAKRDSAHNVTINNIYKKADNEKKQIISVKPNAERVNSILSWGDSIAAANRRPATEW